MLEIKKYIKKLHTEEHKRVSHLVNITQPFGNIVKTFCIGYIVDQHNTHCSSIVASRNRMKSFLSSSIPNVGKEEEENKV